MNINKAINVIKDRYLNSPELNRNDSFNFENDEDDYDLDKKFVIEHIESLFKNNEKLNNIYLKIINPNKINITKNIVNDVWYEIVKNSINLDLLYLSDILSQFLGLNYTSFYNKLHTKYKEQLINYTLIKVNNIKEEYLNLY